MPEDPAPDDSRLAGEEFHRALRGFCDRLVKAGWATGSLITPQAVNMAYTDDGIENLRTLWALLHALEFETMTQDDFSMLRMVLKLAADLHDWDMPELEE